MNSKMNKMTTYKEANRIIKNFIESLPDIKRKKLEAYIGGATIMSIAERYDINKQAVEEQFATLSKKLCRENSDFTEILEVILEGRFVDIKALFPKYHILIEKIAKVVFGKKVRDGFVMSLEDWKAKRIAQDLIYEVGFPFTMTREGHKGAYYDENAYLVEVDSRKNAPWVIIGDKVLTKSSISLLNTFCLWKKKDDKKTIEEVYEYFKKNAPNFLIDKGAEDYPALTRLIGDKKAWFDKSDAYCVFTRDEESLSKFKMEKREELS